MVFVLGGMVFGWFWVDQVWMVVVVFVVGVVFVVVGYGLGGIGQVVGVGGGSGSSLIIDGDIGGDLVLFLGWEDYLQVFVVVDFFGVVLCVVFVVELYSGGMVEILGLGGFVLVVVVLCFLLSRLLWWLLLLFGVFGFMLFMVYSVYVFLVVLVGGLGGFFLNNGFWVVIVVGLLIVMMLWLMFFGCGLLECLVGWGVVVMVVVL